MTFLLARVLTAADMALVVDDWIQTGSQASAIEAGVEAEASEAGFVGMSFIVHDTTAAARCRPESRVAVRSADLPPTT